MAAYMQIKTCPEIDKYAHTKKDNTMKSKWHKGQ